MGSLVPPMSQRPPNQVNLLCFERCQRTVGEWCTHCKRFTKVGPMHHTRATSLSLHPLQLLLLPCSQFWGGWSLCQYMAGTISTPAPPLGLFEAGPANYCTPVAGNATSTTTSGLPWAGRSRRAGVSKWPGLLIVNYLQYLLRYLPFRSLQSIRALNLGRTLQPPASPLSQRQFWGRCAKLVCLTKLTSEQSPTEASNQIKGPLLPTQQSCSSHQQ
jgi:hypothetical protein